MEEAESARAHWPYPRDPTARRCTDRPDTSAHRVICTPADFTAGSHRRKHTTAALSNCHHTVGSSSGDSATRGDGRPIGLWSDGTGL